MKNLLLAATATIALAACSESPEEPVEAEVIEVSWPGVPEEQAAQIREAGRVIDPASFDIFAPLVDAPPYDDVTMVEDVSYGDDASQTFDIYTADDAGEDAERPVLLYVHGGGFVGGDKQGDYYPQSATAWAARNGMVGVNMNYRLAPDAAWPAGRDDLAAVVEWIGANIAEYGGDPDRIFIWGHSAGANHVADYVTHTDMQGPEADRVKGALLLSPAYTVTMGEDPHPYYGEDASLATAGPAIERIGASDIPVMIGYAEYDPEIFHTFAESARDELCGDGSTGTCPEILFLEDHNHMTEGASIGSSDESLSGPFVAWMEGR